MLGPSEDRFTSATLREADRIRALEEYRIIGSPADPDLDRIVKLAARVCRVPMAALFIVGRDRVHVKSQYGAELGDLPRHERICTYINSQDALFCVPDTAADPHLAGSAIVRKSPGIRFYAGVPLVAPSGHKIGAICVFDPKPWSKFCSKDRRALEDVAALVMERLEMRRVHAASDDGDLRFERIASTSPNAIVCADAHGGITFWNKSAEAMMGYSAHEVLGQPVSFVFPDRLRRTQTAKLTRAVRKTAADRSAPRAGFIVRHRDGTELELEMTLSVTRDHDAGFGAVLRDISIARQGEHRLYARAELDPLTGLPNRCRFLAAVRQLSTNGSGTLFQLDLSGFKDINDSLGHGAGDQLLSQAAARLSTLTAAKAKVSRFGADEFAVYWPDLSASEASNKAENLLSLFDLPFLVDAEVVYLGVNIGIARCPDDGTNAEELTANANLALERAKATRRRGYEFFKPEMRQVVIARRTIESELRQALAASQFELFYQPQVILNDASIIGAEALLRWRHPTRGLLAPGAFLSHLEKGPLAADVGNWVLRTACKQAALLRTHHPNFRVAVNLFGAQFDAGDLMSRVEDALLTYKLPPEALELEITENIMLRGEHAIVVPLREMLSRGISIAFDDYGTGFASLNLLKRFPVSRLKIDRSFVRDVCADEEDAAIVQAIIYLGRCFKLNVTAEGIETEEQAETLRMLGCTEGQGYLYAEPLSAAALANYLCRNDARTVA
ncbi:EAL domain-containing protein [Hyphomicrobium sp. D-2]|uniref:sensor domain-containing phosphodiesterase n=1 Tax=Hyphomicrobium sp. D-2 TaxID=3041621 RepID=UPI002453F900|nr:EAL domain-containing protein [Hyphomicrobium sp. D-2]MDH4981896.1 EAL domain-containing protein [Hyphomicrobium sp. D-2]